LSLTLPAWWCPAWSAIALILGLYAFTILPINLAGALLIVLALTLFVLEAKVMSHGILAVGGIVALVLGAVILIDSPIPEMRVRLSTALAIAIPLGVITVFLLRLALAARKAKFTRTSTRRGPDTPDRFSYRVRFGARLPPCP
jgi:membrane-bound serine protease (ClpP class)